MMYRRPVLTMTAICAALVLGNGTAFAQISKTDPRIHDLLEKAYAAQGGAALAKLRTYKENDDLIGSGPFGMRMTQQNSVLLNRDSASGRWQVSKDGKAQAIYQQTSAGIVYWTEKTKTQKLRDASAPFDYVPLTKTGIVGLLALQNTTDTLTFVEKGEIKGKKGAMIVRTQPIPQETVLLFGKGEFARASCQTVWSYLFTPDGTLIAERITQSQPKKSVDVQLSYDRFQIFDGIKIPTEISIKNNQVPSMISLKIRVKQVVINGAVPPSAFAMP